MAEEIKFTATVDAGSATKSLTDLRQAIKEANSSMLEFEAGSDAFNEAAIKAGKLNDKLKDVKEAIKAQTGEPIERLSQSFGLLKDKVLSLDFKGAIDQLKIMKEVINANPMFKLVAVVAAVGAAFLLLKDKVKILGQAFEFLVGIGEAVVKKFTDITDAMGITTIAADKASQAQIAAAQATEKGVTESLDRQILIAKARGEDTLELEKQKQRAIIRSAEEQKRELEKIEENSGRTQTEEQKKRIDELTSQAKNGYAQLTALDEADKRKRADARAAETAEEQKEYEKRLANARKAAEDARKVRADGLKGLRDATANNRSEIQDITDQADATGEAALRTAKQRELDIIEEARRKAGNTPEAVRAYREAVESVNAEYDLKNSVRLQKARTEADRLADEIRSRTAAVIAELNSANQVLQAEAAVRNATSDENRVAAAQVLEQELLKVKQDGLEKKRDADLAALDQKVLGDEKYDAAKKAIEDKYILESEKATEESNTRQDEMVKKSLDQQLKWSEMNAKERAAASLQVASAGINAISNLSNLVFAQERARVKKGSKEDLELQKKQFKANKALQLVNAGINTAQAIVAALSAGGFIGPILAGIAGATGAIQIATIAAAQFNPEGGGTPPTPQPGGGAQVPPQTAGTSTGSAFNPNALISAAPGTNTGGQPIKVYVTESDITDTQNKVSVIQTKSSYP